MDFLFCTDLILQIQRAVIYLNSFSVLGIAFGVMVLTVILSIMNGLQMGYIDTILQVSSGHIRLYGEKEKLLQAENLNLHEGFFIFQELQTLMQGSYGRQHGVLVRSVEPGILEKDRGLAEALKISSGSFDILKEDAVILGYELARQLGVQTGDTVNILAVSGSSGTSLFPANQDLIVTGIFKTGYYEVDSSFAFMSLENGEKIFGNESKLYASVKLKNQNNDAAYISSVAASFPDLKSESWRTYNHAFFGALRIEKNMMMFLVILIFLVVSVNIYNGMRRSIYERREEISVLASLGAYSKHIQTLFIANGFTIGLLGAGTGLLLGLLLSVQINSIFSLIEKIINSVLNFVAILFQNSSDADFAVFSPVYFYMDTVPVRIFFNEILFIFLFGIFSSSAAAMAAARRILRLKPAEVLRYE
nr:FtsX-like permease family protein [Treponema sp. OMZ 791]